MQLTLLSFPTRRSSDLPTILTRILSVLKSGSFRSEALMGSYQKRHAFDPLDLQIIDLVYEVRSEEHTSELQSHVNLVCRLLLEKKKKKNRKKTIFKIY